MPEHRWSRRSLFIGAVVVPVAVVTSRVEGDRTPSTVDLGSHGHGVTRWLVNGEHFPNGFTVPEGEVWAFPYDADTLVTSAKNVIVHGTLLAHPTAPHTNTLRFVDVNEAAFVGGGMEPIASDVGLWVMHHGVLDLQGTPRGRGWNRTGTDPTWVAGDDVMKAPNAKGSRTFVAFTPGSVVPTVTDPWGTVHPTEVFNLTRSVNIEGQPGKRAHVFIHSDMPQTIQFTRFHLLGPRGGAEGNQDHTDVLGRYPLHFHHCGEGSRGSLVEGCVASNGSRAYVPHLSHGIEFRDCIAYKVFDEAFWWDPGKANSSNDITWQHCAGFGVDSVGLKRMGAWRLGSGSGNIVRDCVAAGGLGGKDTSGFEWPEFDHDVWLAEDLVSHNNQGDGIFVWQNDQLAHVITRPTCYRNGSAGIQHGAYGNAYRYSVVRTFDNGSMGDITSQALPKTVHAIKQRWSDVHCDHLLIAEHNKNFSLTKTSVLVFEGLRCNRVTVDESKNAGKGTYELRCASGHDLERADFKVLSKKSVVRVVRSNGSTWTL